MARKKTKSVTHRYASRGITETKGGAATVKRSRVAKIISRVIILFAVAAMALMIVYIQSNTSEKKKKLDQVNNQISRLEIENKELSLTLNSGDLEEYEKKIAMEKYGYAYPDEIRFYDKSHN